MATEHYDIVIAGGGMVGVSLALHLDSCLPAEHRILLVEGFPLPGPNDEFAGAYSPSFDARSTALSYSSFLIYQSLDVWPQLRHHCSPIESIHVSERGRFGSTLMLAQDYDWPALGYVVENAWLGNTLIQCLHQRPRIETLSPARVVAAQPETESVRLQLEDGSTRVAGLLVVADGAESGLRDSLGVSASRRHYGQDAIIANVSHARGHEGRAFERFTEQGPLAMLPLTDVDGQHRSALVWTLPPEQAQTVVDLSEAAFLQQLQQAFGYRLGRLLDVAGRHRYPLALVEADEQVRSGVCVMGNAAHALHPVAGQGFNLALRDVARLGQVLASSAEAPGSLQTLQRYRRLQAEDQARTIAFSDRLPELFSSRDPALGTLRDLGLFALDLAPALKREFVRQTAGVAALGGSLDRSAGPVQ